MPATNDIRDLVIIGSGPAGYTAAIYAARARMNPLMYAGYQAGGQLMLTSEVENFPGFEHGVQGPNLMEVMRKQAQRFGAEIHNVDVTKVDFSKRPFTVWVDDKSVQAKAVIIATGASAKLLGLPSEKSLMGKGVSTCATCDGAFFKDADIIVAGGGDSAMEEANFLTRFAKKVYLVHRRDEFRAIEIMLDRARANPKVEFMLDTIIEKIDDESKNTVTGATLKNTKTGKVTQLKIDGVFVAIGHTPNTKLFAGQIDVDAGGYIVTKKGTATNVEGVFAAGDVVDHTYRQAITAAGMGCQSALDAERWLAHAEHVETPIHAGAWGTTKEMGATK